jgi:hypothetical protein
LSSQHVTPTIVFIFLKCSSRLSYLPFFTFCSMIQSNHVNINQSQGINFMGCFNLVIVWIKYVFLLWPKIMI